MTEPEPVELDASGRPRSRSGVELLVDLVIVAPLGFGATIVDELPNVIRRGRQEIKLARFIGKMVVTHGLGEAQRRIVRSSSLGVSEPDSDASQPAPDAMPSARASARDDAGAAIAAGDLVLPDYDHLPAAHVVAKLASLEQFERDAIERYELAHRHRRTILGKLDQLRTA
jgi:hypothetical protein